MKKHSFLVTTLVIFFTLLCTSNLQAQLQDCVICPDLLGVTTTTKNGMNISSANVNTVTANQKKKTVTEKKEKNTPTGEIAGEATAEENLIMGFIDAAAVAANEEKAATVTTYNSELCGDPIDCGLVTQEEFNNAQQTFTIYPNPAHHWVVVNLKELETGNYRLLLKDSQGTLLKERGVTEQTANLDLRMLKKGVYFITLKNETTYKTWVQKVTVQ